METDANDSSREELRVRVMSRFPVTGWMQLETLGLIPPQVLMALLKSTDTQSAFDYIVADRSLSIESSGL